MRQRNLLSLVGGLLLVVQAGPAVSKMYRPPASFGQEATELPFVDQRVMPAVDNAALLAAAKRSGDHVGLPYRFAHAIQVDLDVRNSGTWERLDDGSWLWRLRISSPGALHLNLGFSRFGLPEGAGVWIYDPAREDVEGPYTARHRSARGRLWTPIVRGDEVVVELHVPDGTAEPLDLRLSRVNHGFRGFEKSGACNNDVICPEGDPWRNQIRSVARVAIGGVSLCSGQLINSTAQDGAPYFLSAFHCGFSPQNDDTVVVYWKYEAPVCGQQTGGSLGFNQTGSTFRASEESSDFALVELSQDPDPEFDVYFTGWDVSGVPPLGSVGIHHPSGDVKSISFNDDVLTTTAWIEPDTHWMVDDWEDGTTEGGSSGSCLWDPASKLCVGILTAGLASCTVIDFDLYGKLAVAWEGGGTPETRLRDWLDPLASGAQALAGRDQMVEIFADGFESGNLSAWSANVP
jgi:hypothetical protein